MKDDAGAAERIKDCASLCAGGSKIDEDLGKFGRKHTDESVASRACVVAFCVGGDILGANRDSGIFAVFDDFNVVSFFAKLVMMRSGGTKNGAFAVRYETDIAPVALE